MAFKLAELYTELTTKDTKFQRAMSRARRAAVRVHNAMKAVSRTAKRMLLVGGAALGGMAALAMRQEKAERMLSAALSTTGQSAEMYAAKLRKSAAEMQKVTVYGDEFIMELMAQGINLGATGDKIEQMTRDSIGLATALKMDLGTAMRYMTLATQGEMTMLRRYIPALRTATSVTEQLAIVNRTATAGWEQAQAEAKTTTGQMAQLKNVLGDLGEDIGLKLLPSIRVVARLIKDWARETGDLVPIIKTVGIALFSVWAAPKIIGAIRGVYLGIRSVGSASKATAGMLTGAATIAVTALAVAYTKLQMAAFSARMEMARVYVSSGDTSRLIKDIKKAERELERAQAKGDTAGEISALTQIVMMREALVKLQEDEVAAAQALVDNASMGDKALGAMGKGILVQYKERLALEEETARRFKNFQEKQVQQAEHLLELAQARRDAEENTISTRKPSLTNNALTSLSKKTPPAVKARFSGLEDDWKEPSTTTKGGVQKKQLDVLEQIEKNTRGVNLQNGAVLAIR